LITTASSTSQPVVSATVSLASPTLAGSVMVVSQSWAKALSVPDRTNARPASTPATPATSNTAPILLGQFFMVFLLLSYLPVYQADSNQPEGLCQQPAMQTLPRCLQ